MGQRYSYFINEDLFLGYDLVKKNTCKFKKNACFFKKTFYLCTAFQKAA